MSTERILPRSVFIPIFIGILVFAGFTRSYDTTLRPLHNDEAVNFHFLQEIDRKGYYPYSHENYHGPFYFYITYGLVKLFGEDELGLRLSAILIGALTPLLLLPFRRYAGDGFVLLGALLVTLCPSLMFYSRYAIHESLFLFLTLWIAVVLFQWFRERKARYIFLGFLPLALIIATKETFIIALFCLFFATLALGDLRGAWKSLYDQKQWLFFGGLVGSLVLILCFTGGFQWAGGIREMFLAVPQWMGRNTSDVGHHKEFFYYLKKMMLVAEPYHLLVLFLPGLFALLQPKECWKLLRSEEGQLMRFLTVWCVLSFLVYSYVKYKTPWLIINFTLPAVLAVAWWLDYISRESKTSLMSAFGVGIVVIFMSGHFSWRYNVEIPYGPKNPFSYVHTSPGMVELLEDVEKYWDRSSQSKVLIGVASYWPLPYYLRGELEPGALFENRKAWSVRRSVRHSCDG